jgi:hypothetical protein
MPRLIDMRMHDGSRHFGGLPETYDVAWPQWHRLRGHVTELVGATLRGFVTDDVTEAWIDFEFRGQAFSINNQHGWFCARAPASVCHPVRARVPDLLGGSCNPVVRRCGRKRLLPPTRALLARAAEQTRAHPNG